MARGWRLIDLTGASGNLSGSRGRIVFQPEGGEKKSLPAEDLAVVLAGPGTALTTGALHYLAKHDVVLLVADWRGVPYLALNPWKQHGRVAARQIAQADLSLPRKKNAWMRIVSAKVTGQGSNLKVLDRPGSQRMQILADSVRSGDPQNIEGTAARHYWSRLFDGYPDFIRDQRLGDSINAALNYGYMVLRGYTIRAVAAAGLASPLGFFHRNRENYFNLVDDLIEPFRPAVDFQVAQLPHGSSVSDPETKKALVNAANQTFTSDGGRIPSVLEDFAQQFGRYVEGDISRITAPVWRGPIEPNDRTDRDEE